MKILTICFLCALITLSGCKKQWICPYYGYGITAIKGNDTIINSVYLNYPYDLYGNYNLSYFQSLKNYYLSEGYHVEIDSVYYQNNTITNHNEVIALEKDGYKCIEK